MKRALWLFIACFLAAVPLWAGESAGAESAALTHRMMMLAIQLGVILFAARMGNLLFTALRLPSVLGELCAGIAIGPFALGRLWGGWIFQAAGTPVGVTPELYGLCTVASIVLLFLVGAETDLRMFMRYSAVGSLVGIGGVAASYFTGAGVGVWLMGLSWSDPTAILMGVMSTATSVSITARILSERRKLDSQEGVTILAGAVIDDVLGIILLAIGMGMIAAGDAGGGISWRQIGGIAARSFGFWLGGTMVAVLSSRKVARLLKRCGSHGEVAVLTLGLALVVGGCFEQAHLAMIIGAYVTGLAFSRTEMGLMIQEKLHGVYQFLVPVFFVVMGMMVDVREFCAPGVLTAGLVYTAVAVTAKVLGCGLPTLCFGFTPMGALRVGLGMVPRGEVALIIAGIAAAHGHTEVLGVAVLMTLLTTLAAPPLLIAAFKAKARGHRKAEENAPAPSATFHFPNHAVMNTVMAKIAQNLTREGFFVHQIDPAQGLYQARRADVILTIQAQGETIAISVSEAALPFVRNVVAESLAEYESVLDALRKPVTERAQLGVASEAETARKLGAAAQRRAVLARYVREETICPRLPGTTRDEVIRNLMARLHETGAVTDVEQATEAVLSRERVMATGVGYGVACPHARTEMVRSLVCAIGVTEVPVDFSEEPEGRACRIIILTLTPNEANSPYMTFITAVLTALRSAAKREAVLAAADARAIRKALVQL
ncbi:MAG: cation:proton antiporter [Lentisphaeraceae bacterium]|nr:cation:proton antiporter [Lentisphaeraceae bacterium]